MRPTAAVSVSLGGRSVSETFTNLEAAISLLKLQRNSSRQIWRQVSAKMQRATRLVHPNYYSLFDSTIQTSSEMISYHFTGIIFSHGFITLISTHNMQ